MNNHPKYFRLATVRDGKNEVEEIGSKVFENHGFAFYSGISNNSLFIDIIYKYVADCNIKRTEEDLISRGFAIVNTDDIPKELLAKVPYLICNKHSISHSILLHRTEALAYLNKYLPTMTDSLNMYLKRK